MTSLESGRPWIRTQIFLVCPVDWHTVLLFWYTISVEWKLPFVAIDDFEMGFHCVVQGGLDKPELGFLKSLFLLVGTSRNLCSFLPLGSLEP